ncbi:MULTISPECIES: DUF4352 domain-containing protein [Acinetobacter]|uniref:hypothetical protein n=1 Tax=Acinetobacter TaxID=469 RepID=UPI0002AEDE72|nr:MULTISPECIES: hypothetical protein [Acinetobacter]ELW85708.1 hypothetical protein ACINWC743_A0749 [Acinetobacter sp. WC-743]MBJ8427825.1 hypothetical protein [Acinetobacter bereziniae]
MKNKFYAFFTSIIILLIITALFGAWFYYFYALKNISDSPFKETLSLSLTFLGSFGTLASIVFAFYLYIKQREKDEDDEKAKIRSSKPTFFIKIDDFYKSNDSNGQPALAIDFNIKNYNNNASSFSLQFDYLPNKKEKILVEFDYPYNKSDIFKSGENLNITAIFTSCDDILNPPRPEDLNIYIKAVYLDSINNKTEDYFLLEKSKRDTVPFIKSNVMTPSGNFFEMK